MIKNLQRKFIVTMMGVLIIVFVVIFITLNLFMQNNSAKQTEMLLQTVAENDGNFFISPQKHPKNNDPDAQPFLPYSKTPEPHVLLRAGRFFYVKVDDSDNVIDVHYDMIMDFTRETAVDYASYVLKRNKTQGSVDNYQYLVSQKDYGKIIVFAERSIELKLLSQLIYYSLIVAGVSCVFLFIFSIILSRWVIKPVKRAFEKQRRFISDASHELKTPLTIISANADVLEHEIGSNYRISTIREQSGRMNSLIHDMLALARADEVATQIRSMSSFDYSQVALNTVLEFESRAFEEGKTLEYDIEENLSFFGNPVQIRQTISILVDNAIKYSNPSGTIEVRLKKQNRKLILSVYNTGSGIDEAEKDRIFERFYRSDDSRSRETGGYGLGLAIAKSNVDLHKGKIIVSGCAGEWVCFTVQLSNHSPASAKLS